MKCFLTLLIGTLWAFSFPKESLPSHALYLGTIQLKHEAGADHAQMNIKVFSDDLQSAVRNASAGFQTGPLSNLFEKNETLIKAYFRQHTNITINGQLTVPTLSKWNQQNDVHLLTFELSCPTQWQEVEFKANFFMELFPTQSNVVSIMNGERRQFARLNKQKSNCQAKF